MSLSVASKTVDPEQNDIKDERNEDHESCYFHSSADSGNCTTNTLPSQDQNGRCETQAMQQKEYLSMLGTSEGVDPEGAVCVNESNEARHSNDSYCVSFQASASLWNDKHDPSEPQVMQHEESLPRSAALVVPPVEAVNAKSNKVQQSNDSGLDGNPTSLHNENERSNAEVVHQKESIQPRTNRSKENSDQAEALSWDENRLDEIAGMQQRNSLPLPAISLSEDHENGNNFLINHTNDLVSSPSCDDQTDMFLVEESLEDEPI